ncbi:MAG: acyl-CoA dehydrogenase family protein [Rhizomicrobium sp.]
MDLALSKEDEAFRDEVRQFLEQNLSREIRDKTARMTSVYADVELMRSWHARLYERGWVAPAWPREYGGCGWSVVRRYIFAAELAQAGAPPISAMGVKMCGPAIIRFGTAEQKSANLPRIISGQDFWCQGYSEPGAGSDLASLQMKAEPDGDSLICTGEKIWTTHAQYANKMFCLVRTSRGPKVQNGITFLLVDMDTDGIAVEPIWSLTGEHIQNRVHFANVRVPKANVVGEIDGGWTVAKYLLEFERGGSTFGPSLRARLKTLKAIAGSEPDGSGHRLSDEPWFAQRLAALEVEVEALELTELRVMSALSRGQSPGHGSSLQKLLGTELAQVLTELTVSVMAYYSATHQPCATRPGGPVLPYLTGLAANAPVGPEHSWTAGVRYFNERAGTIYAGSSEIQRNILAKSALDL